VLFRSDNAKFGWFHLKAVLISGSGFFADAYDIFIISLVLPMIYRVYYPPSDPNSVSSFGHENAFIDGLIKSSTNWGNLVGQLAFGFLGDQLGRKKMYGVELMIIIVATFSCAIASSAVRGFNILFILGFWRFILGIGIGGDYPMSAVITSEFANTKQRGQMIAAVFAQQGIGILVGGLVTVATLAAFKMDIQNNPMSLDYVWRIIVGMGLVPALLTIYFRLTMPETPRFTQQVLGDTKQAKRDIERVLLENNERFKSDLDIEEYDEPVKTASLAMNDDTFLEHFSKWKNLRVLLGTSYSWFALDVAWYGLSLNQPRILDLINYSGKGATTLFDIFYSNAVGAVIIACMGTVPGYWVTVFYVEKLGRRFIQMLGFAVITVILLIMSVFWDYIKENVPLFIALFTISNFFFNFGPNQTTFIVAGEVFPTRWRSTCHGISAASGKLGAIIGIQVIAPFFNSHVQIVLFLFSIIMATGWVATYYLVPETAGKTLEQICLENYGNDDFDEERISFVRSSTEMSKR